jgi:hypothetical protein
MADVIVHFKDGTEIVIHKHHAMQEALKIQADMTEWIAKNNTICFVLSGVNFSVESHKIAKIEIRNVS